MSGRPSILCPIDFSEASAGALRYAAAIADPFAARLIVFSVEEPLLTGAADLGTGCGGRPRRARTTWHFAAKTFGSEPPSMATLEYERDRG